MPLMEYTKDQVLNILSLVTDQPASILNKWSSQNDGILAQEQMNNNNPDREGIYVIFLDIDGVMNSTIFYENRYKKRWLKWKTYRYYLKKLLMIKPKSISLLDYKAPKRVYEFDYQYRRLVEETDKLKWKWLSEFCNNHNVKICISSVWKNHFADEDHVLPERWRKALLLLGFNPDIFIGITGARRTLRGQEIKEWLNQRNDIIDYAILDDDSDMLTSQMNRFHHSDTYYGLSPNHLYRISRQFGFK